MKNVGTNKGPLGDMSVEYSVKVSEFLCCSTASVQIATGDVEEEHNNPDSKGRKNYKQGRNFNKNRSDPDKQQ